ncbi:MAG: cytochrome c biogenesis protein CcsA [Alphaproteobacteria bacterium]|jgi:ABC-type uncharacterized transport system permease subunit
MLRSLLFNIAALASLAPAALIHLRYGEQSLDDRRPDGVFWAVLAVALAGSASWAATLLGADWHTGFSVTLWVSIAASLALFMGLSLMTRTGWRLTPLLLPYLLLLGIVATIWAQAPEQPLATQPGADWLGVHILISVLTYGLLTIAAVAGFAVVLQEGAIKAKRPTRLTRILPSVADGESLQIRLLMAGEIVLGVDLITGVAAQYAGQGTFLSLDHKTLLSLLAFLIIALLLLAHWRTGIRGRRVARYLLVAYLLLSLAYPGVKFVTDVLMS